MYANNLELKLLYSLAVVFVYITFQVQFYCNHGPPTAGGYREKCAKFLLLHLPRNAGALFFRQKYRDYSCAG